MKTKITSVSLPMEVWEALKGIDNRSRYITSLIKRDLGIGITKKPSLTKADIIKIIRQYLEENSDILTKKDFIKDTSNHDITAHALQEIEKIISAPHRHT